MIVIMGVHIAPAGVADFAIAFHGSLGFDTKIVDDYNGPRRAMAVFHRDLPLSVSWP